jgi:hypothetical protein
MTELHGGAHLPACEHQLRQAGRYADKNTIPSLCVTPHFSVDLYVPNKSVTHRNAKHQKIKPCHSRMPLSGIQD